jgi:dTDP-glucose 4,6-dehydratase
MTTASVTDAPPRVVVIGSNSFSGAAFVAHCLAEGREVLGISRSPEADPVFLPYRWDPRADQPARFRFLQLDLNRDTTAIVDAIATEPSIVVNFAAQGMVAESWEQPVDWYRTNVLANIALHDGLRRLETLRSYVHVSTPEVYGAITGEVGEDQPFDPSTPYAASRAACELHLRTFIRQHRFPAVITRAANVCGPGQQLYRIIPRTLLFLALGRRLSLHGGGRSVRSFIHIDDVARGTLLAAERGDPGEVFHFATRRAVSIHELVAMICAQAGVALEDFVENAPDRPGKDPAYLLNSDRARQRLGWSDRIALEETIQQTSEWVSAHLEHLRDLPHHYIHQP